MSSLAFIKLLAFTVALPHRFSTLCSVARRNCVIPIVWWRWAVLPRRPHFLFTMLHRITMLCKLLYKHLVYGHTYLLTQTFSSTVAQPLISRIRTINKIFIICSYGFTANHTSKIPSPFTSPGEASPK